MVSSDSQMLNPTNVSRSTLYFGQWQYVILFKFVEASFLRKLNHSAIDESINYRNSWLAQRSWQSKISDTTKLALHRACDYFLQRQHPYKKVVSGHRIWLYTNHLGDFADIATVCQPGTVLYVNQAELTLCADAVSLKKPQHAFRTFFRDRMINSDELANLRRYFQTRDQQFRLCPAFSELVHGKRMWLMNSYFVDHNEPNADFLINMVVPGIVRKTLPIVGRTK